MPGILGNILEWLLSNVLGWIIGLIILVLIVALLNLLFASINRLIKGAERVEALVLVCSRETIEKYASEAILPSSWGAAQINTKLAILRLFRQPVGESKLERWIKGGRVFLCLQPQNVADLAEQSAAVGVKEIAQSNISREQLKKARIYSVASSVSDSSHKAHLVLVGNIPSPPLQFTVEPY